MFQTRWIWDTGNMREDQNSWALAGKVDQKSGKVSERNPLYVESASFRQRLPSAEPMRSSRLENAIWKRISGVAICIFFDRRFRHYGVATYVLSQLPCRDKLLNQAVKTPKVVTQYVSKIVNDLSADRTQN